jgi:hypothetical protein
MAAVPLPARHSDKAPRFDPNNPPTLSEYFTDYELLAAAAKLSEEDKVSNAPNYVPRTEGDYWRSIEEYSAVPASYTAFKRAILEAYPGSTPEEKWSLLDLERFCSSQTARQITTRGEFAQFDREFTKIAAWLKRKRIAEDTELQRWYYKAIDVSFRDRLVRRLEIVLPQHKPDEVYAYKDLREAAHHILAGTPTTLDPAASPRATSMAYDPHPLATSATFLPVKKEESDFEKLTLAFTHSVETAMANLLSRMPQQYGNGNRGYSAPPQQLPQVGQSNGSAMRPRPGDIGQRCFWCHETSHFLGGCGRLNEYFGSGKVRRDNTGSIVLGNGDRIPLEPRGSAWQQRVDEYYQRNPGMLPQPRPPLAQGERDAPPHQPASFSANLVGVDDVPEQGSEAEQEFEEEDEDDAEMFQTYLGAMKDVAGEYGEQEGLKRMIQVFENRVQEKKKRAPPKKRGMDEPVAPSASAAPAAEQSKGPQEKPSLMRPYIDVPRLPKPPQIAKPPPRAPGIPAPAPPQPPSQQFRYQAPCETGVKALDVFNRTLSEKVVLSIEELIALCPDVRKYYKEATTTKRVPVAGRGKGTEVAEANLVSTYLSMKEGDLVEAEHSLPLRTIEVSLNGVTSCTGILDNGCQIVIIRRDVWRRLQVPLRPDRIMFMESANGGSNATSGMVPRVIFEIGNVRLPCPVQVVEDAPFECLLGRTFTALAEAVTKEFRDGEMNITLTDPNTGLVITVPTQARTDKRRQEAAGEEEDF